MKEVNFFIFLDKARNPFIWILKRLERMSDLRSKGETEILHKKRVEVIVLREVSEVEGCDIEGCDIREPSEEARNERDGILVRDL